jgi:formylmethanofuran dehydrogenase subunit E
MVTIKSKTGPINLEEYIQQVLDFHGYTAPGVILGGFMVDLAYRHLPPNGIFDAVCETEKCLPDAIQLLTTCSTGNGWLKVINLGRFALTIYDKDSGEGIRVYINPVKLDNWPEIKTWFYNLKPKKEQNLQLLLEQIKEAGADICGYTAVKVDLHFLGTKHRTGFAICPRCHESYPAADGKICLSCQGKSDYLKS